ncbi:hypothetical protein K0M31_010686 [Melipona bicolor]|uniref:Uncharacterized protein n=1 Tax=Melipona bicolor TaxID=60889 RepID=A0AA40KHV5_9HYME|nr:hypothetical protein K0M31_010686 [Melipona bicolor]
MFAIEKPAHSTKEKVCPSCSSSSRDILPLIAKRNQRGPLPTGRAMSSVATRDNDRDTRESAAFQEEESSRRSFVVHHRSKPDETHSNQAGSNDDRKNTDSESRWNLDLAQQKEDVTQ